MKDRRIARFVIDFNLIDDDPDLVRLALAGLIVIRAEARMDYGAIEYVAIGPQFADVGSMGAAPTLVPVFQREIDADGVRHTTLLRWDRA